LTEQTLRDWPLHQAEFTLPMRYLARGQGPGTVVMLHGYQDHALSMTRRMGWLEASLPFQILAVNGPFPVPVWKASGFVEAYSWYFRDTSRDIMIVHPSTTAARIADLVNKVVPKGTPLALYGFSQGGYLASYLAKFLPDTRAIIGLGSGYPADAYAELNKNIKVFAVHGERDDRWPIEASKTAHQRLLDQGFKGEFHVIKDLDHRVDPSLTSLISRMALESFGVQK
jgi:predicted esterase